MPSLSNIAFQARSLASSSTNPEIKQLATLLLGLAKECEDIEKKAEHAEHEARRAGRK